MNERGPETIWLPIKNKSKRIGAALGTGQICAVLCIVGRRKELGAKDIEKKLGNLVGCRTR